MFSKRFSSTPSQLRPGVTSGFYPEKKQVSPGPVERGWHTCKGLFLGGKARPGKYKHILAAIHQHCKKLEKLNDTQFAEQVARLRPVLHQNGLNQDLTVKAFALVREAAWRTLGMRHYDCQLIGGWIMVHGGLAEMETGEGKTLTATLAAGAAGLAGIPVHIVTVNDYLVERDASMMQPLYAAIGLSVAGVTASMDGPARRLGYRCDIAYCTNKQVAFDYLRDRIVLGNDHGRLRFKLEKLHKAESRTDRLFLRGLCFGIIDEADSVLIDEARTPLIISREIESPGETQTYCEASEFAGLFEMGDDFEVDHQNRSVSLTDAGRKRLREVVKGKGGIWSGLRRSEELIVQALSAQHLYIRDHHYLVQDGKILIIDENTGRIMEDRSWERGLHQLIEIKEYCSVSGQREYIARITYQRFYRRYVCLAGMSGTVSEVQAEIWNVYGLPIEKVITNKPGKRQDLGQTFYLSKDDKWQGVIRRIQKRRVTGQPVLIGTRSVADSEHLSRLLDLQGIEHQVLNARQDHREAEIIALAGTLGSVTVATNMAGRGTDIPLGKGVLEVGGLHVISTEINSSRRIDRQLSGRCGRQGDPGSHEILLAADDELLFHYLSRGIQKYVCGFLLKHSKNFPVLGLYLTGLAQKNVEKKHRTIRRDLLQMEEQVGKLLAFSGSLE